MQLKSVVLPAPFGPIKPTISPFSILIETSLRATYPPNPLVTLLHRISSVSVFLQERTAQFFSGKELDPVLELSKLYRESFL